MRVRKPIRVRLSPEGQMCLCPRKPLYGLVVGRKDGLIMVQEKPNTIAAYHPDFLEIVEDHVNRKPRKSNQSRSSGRNDISTI